MPSARRALQLQHHREGEAQALGGALALPAPPLLALPPPLALPPSLVLAVCVNALALAQALGRALALARPQALARSQALDEAGALRLPVGEGEGERLISGKRLGAPLDDDGALALAQCNGGAVALPLAPLKPEALALAGALARLLPLPPPP